MNNQNDLNRDLHSTEGINQEVQKTAQAIDEVERNITYATYLAALHDKDAQVIFWRTIALGLLAFFTFNAILIIIIIVRA